MIIQSKLIPENIKNITAYVYDCNNCPHADNLMYCHNCPLYNKAKIIF